MDATFFKPRRCIGFFRVVLLVNLCVFYTNLFSTDFISSDASTGFQLIEELPNPSIIGLGYAGTARWGSSFSGYNPSSIYFKPQPYLATEYGYYPQAQLHHYYLESQFPLYSLYAGLLLRSETVEGIYRTDWLGNIIETGASSWQFTHLGTNIAFEIYNNLFGGVCLNFIQDRILDFAAYAVSGSFGLNYTLAVHKMQFGLAILNIGMTTPMRETFKSTLWGRGERLPLTSRFGISWNIIVEGIPCSIASDIVYRDVRDNTKPFSHRIKNRFTLPVGVEINPLYFLNFRMGKRFNHPTEIATVGFGLNKEPLNLDVSFVIPRLISNTELKIITSITYTFTNSGKNIN